LFSGWFSRFFSWSFLKLSYLSIGFLLGINMDNINSLGFYIIFSVLLPVGINLFLITFQLIVIVHWETENSVNVMGQETRNSSMDISRGRPKFGHRILFGVDSYRMEIWKFFLDRGYHLGIIIICESYRSWEIIVDLDCRT